MICPSERQAAVGGDPPAHDPRVDTQLLGQALGLTRGRGELLGADFHAVVGPHRLLAPMQRDGPNARLQPLLAASGPSHVDYVAEKQAHDLLALGCERVRNAHLRVRVRAGQRPRLRARASASRAPRARRPLARWW